MQTKALRFTSKEKDEQGNRQTYIEHMSINDVLEKFTPMIKRDTLKYNKPYYGDPLPDQDFEALLTKEMWIAYDKYDIDKGTCFTTLLHQHLKKGRRDAFQPGKSERRSGMEEVCMDAPISSDEGSTFGDMMPSEIKKSPENQVIAQEFSDEMMAVISNNLEGNEPELLKMIANKESNQVIEYADRNGITRQSVYYQINKLKNKLANALRKQNLDLKHAPEF